MTSKELYRELNKLLNAEPSVENDEQIKDFMLKHSADFLANLEDVIELAAAAEMNAAWRHNEFLRQRREAGLL